MARVLQQIMHHTKLCCNKMKVVFLKNDDVALNVQKHEFLVQYSKNGRQLLSLCHFGVFFKNSLIFRFDFAVIPTPVKLPPKFILGFTIYIPLRLRPQLRLQMRPHSLLQVRLTPKWHTKGPGLIWDILQCQWQDRLVVRPLPSL